MTGKTYVLRCRLPVGLHTIDHLTDVDTVNDLKVALFSLTDIHPNRLLVFAGVPPTKLNLEADERPLSELIAHQRETLIVSENKGLSLMISFILNFSFLVRENFHVFTINNPSKTEEMPRTSTRHQSDVGSTTLSAERHFTEPSRRSLSPVYDQTSGFLLRKVVSDSEAQLAVPLNFLFECLLFICSDHEKHHFPVLLIVLFCFNNERFLLTILVCLRPYIFVYQTELLIFRLASECAN